MSINEKITLSVLKNYLVRQHWRECDIKIDLPITFWKNEQFPEAELRLPNNENLSDYDSAIFRVVQELAFLEGCEVQELIVTLHSQDTINIRIVGDDVENGTIPLQDGALLFQSAESLIKSAVSKILIATKKMRKRQQIDEFMDSVRLGQTQHGSYAINIITPNTISETIQADYTPVTTSEILNDTIYKALQSLKVSVAKYQKDDDIQIFEYSKIEGADLGICNALLAMSGENQERDVEINLSSGASEYKYSKRTVYFTAPEMKPVAKAVDYLSGRNYVLKNQLFIGQITK